MTKNNSYTVNGFLVSAESDSTQRGSVTVRKFQLKTKEEYPQLLEFELVNKATGLVDGLAVGQELNVLFSLRGREWNGRVFHNLNAFKIEPLKATAAVSTPKAKAAAAPAAPVAHATTENTDTNDEPVF